MFVEKVETNIYITQVKALPENRSPYTLEDLRSQGNIYVHACRNQERSCDQKSLVLTKRRRY